MSRRFVYSFLSILVFFISCSSHKPHSSLEMVYVKGGTFRMGSEGAEEDLMYPDEFPAHDVTLSDFMISKYEVTVADYAEFVRQTGYVTVAETEEKGSACRVNGMDVWIGGASWRCDVQGRLLDSTQYNFPVVHVSWLDACAYCDYLSKLEGKTYRLPTEAEWEFAARGGVKSKGYLYSGSNDLRQVGYYSMNSEGVYHPVGQLKPNELGIYDMSGNALEFCYDNYALYTADPQKDPIVTSKSKKKRIILRGGSWASKATTCRSVNRKNNAMDNRGAGGGFRVVCQLDAKDTAK